MNAALAIAVLGMALAALPAPWRPAVRAQGGAPVGGVRLSLGYDGRLIFKVLQIEVEAKAAADGFEASSRLTSAGILAAFKHIDERASSQGRIIGSTPQPGVFDYQNLGGKTHRKVRAIWTGGDVTLDADPPFKDLGDPPASLPQKLAAADPLTALMRMTLNASRETVCRKSYLFFDGKQLYALDFTNPRSRDGPLTEAEMRLGLTGPFRCDVRFREVAGFHDLPTDPRNQGLQRPIEVDFAQVGSGGPWVISSLRAQTPLGWAVIELQRLKLASEATAG